MKSQENKHMATYGRGPASFKKGFFGVGGIFLLIFVWTFVSLLCVSRAYCAGTEIATRAEQDTRARVNAREGVVYDYDIDHAHDIAYVEVTKQEAIKALKKHQSAEVYVCTPQKLAITHEVRLQRVYSLKAR